MSKVNLDTEFTITLTSDEGEERILKLNKEEANELYNQLADIFKTPVNYYPAPNPLIDYRPYDITTSGGIKLIKE